MGVGGRSCAGWSVANEVVSENIELLVGYLLARD